MKKQVVLFGAGIDAEKIIMLNQQEIIAIIDNKKSGHLNGIPLITLADYLQAYSQYEIMISSSKYAREIKHQLLKEGIINFELPDALFKNNDVMQDEDISHDNWINYLCELCDNPGAEILEVGSRRVCGYVKENFKNANYTGFDYYAGENVDVVGDAHKS